MSIPGSWYIAARVLAHTEVKRRVQCYAGRKADERPVRLELGAVSTLSKRYLCEYRHLLRAHGELQAAWREGLKTFVGWPSALELVHRLDELYR